MLTSEANSTPARPRVLFIGDNQFADFAGPFRRIAEFCDVIRRPDMAKALASLNHEFQPSLTIVAVERPGQIAESEIQDLRQAAPLTRIVALLSSWCEGEVRSGHPWPGVPRVYWHQFDAQFVAFQARQPSLWELPSTIHASEWASHPAQVESNASSGLVGIYAATSTDFDGLADACDCGGFASVWMNSPSPPCLHGLSAVIWSGLDTQDESCRLAEVAELHPETPLIAVMGFPREFEQQEILTWGVSALVSKPLRIEWLLSPLVELVGQRQVRSAKAA